MKTIIDSDFRGERMSFLQLIEKYNIVIPVIQRDYAQGRTNDEHVIEVRKNFVRNLISYLRDVDDSSHDLDFIYGTVNETSKHDLEFIPLDGQQRLTTLFLLHWYLAGRSGNFDYFVEKMKSKTNEYKFAYKTRDSSKMFCERLLSGFEIKNDERTEETNIFKELEKKEKEEDAEVSYISKTIQNQGWFFNSWLNDPTVAGMLVMLTEIDEQFKKISENYSWTDAYNRLCENEYPPITFQLLPLNGYDRTDDLYIKLNARGIHLSDFENFKARIEDLMEMDGMDGTYVADFKQKIDGKWAEYLWQYRGGGDNTDAIMENLFRNFIALSYRTNNTDGLKDRMDYLLEQNKKKLRFTFSRYCELEVMHRRDEDTAIDSNRKELEKKMIESVSNMFDVWCDDKTAPENANCKWLRADQYIKNRFIASNATYPNRLRLYAYLLYCNLHKESIDNDDLCQWIRLVRNLQDATDINGSDEFYQGLRSVDDLLAAIGSKNVQEWLATDARNYNVKFFRSRQMKEECIKAELMAREKVFGLDTIGKAVVEGDDDEYLTGQMGFVLEFAGAYKKYDANEISNMPENEIKDLGKNIRDYLLKTQEIIKNTPSWAAERLLERALLSLGMYLRANSSNRYNFCNTSEQYNTWKIMLYVENNNKYCRDIFKALLDKVSLGNIESKLRQIIQEHLSDTNIPEWRKLLIENPSLIDYCRYGFIYIEGDATTDVKKVILLGASQMNHYHAELWTRDLYENEKKKSNNGVKYREQKKYEERSTAYLEFTHNDIPYEFRLSHWDGKWSWEIINVNDSNAPVELNLNELDISQNDSGEEILYKAQEWILRIK